MNDAIPANDADPTREDDDAIARDMLLARAVAGDRAALDEVRARGGADPALFEELALWQADELRLVRAAHQLNATADAVDLPVAEARGEARVSGRFGWFAAALLAVALLVRPWSGDAARGLPERAQVAGFGLPQFETSDEAFEAYLAKAREDGVVVGDVAPPTLLRSRELGDGRGFEVVIVRQIVERRESREIYRVAPMGETGQLRPILVRPRTDLVQ